MKQIKVLHRFRDKNNYSHIYGVGEVVTFDDERANDIVARGLGEFVAPKKENGKHKPSDTPAAPGKTEGGEGAGGEGTSETHNENDGTDANNGGKDEESESVSESASESASASASESTSESAETAEQKAEETAKVHEPAAPKETKKPKSNGSRSRSKKAE